MENKMLCLLVKDKYFMWVLHRYLNRIFVKDSSSQHCFQCKANSYTIISKSFQPLPSIS